MEFITEKFRGRFIGLHNNNKDIIGDCYTSGSTFCQYWILISFRDNKDAIGTDSVTGSIEFIIIISTFQILYKNEKKVHC